MDDSRFDRIARSFGNAASRRSALRGLAAAVLGATGLGVALSEINARRRRNRDRDRRRCGVQYDGCNEDRDCCEGLLCFQLNRTTAEAKFDGTCGYKRGCGKKNDFCQKNRDCCRQFHCRGRRCKRRQ